MNNQNKCDLECFTNELWDLTLARIFRPPWLFPFKNVSKMSFGKPLDYIVLSRINFMVDSRKHSWQRLLYAGRGSCFFCDESFYHQFVNSIISANGVSYDFVLKLCFYYCALLWMWYRNLVNWNHNAFNSRHSGAVC